MIQNSHFRCSQSDDDVDHIEVQFIIAPSFRDFFEKVES